MKIEFRNEPLAELSTAALVAYCFEGAPASSGTVERLPAETRKLLEQMQSAGELTGKAFECTMLRWPAGMAASKLLVVGAGKTEKFSDAHLRNTGGRGSQAFAFARGTRTGLGSCFHRTGRGGRRCGWRFGG